MAVAGRLPFVRVNVMEKVRALVSGIGGVSDDEVEKVKSSFALLVPVAAQFTQSFYDRLFQMAPESRVLFRSSMIQQRDKLFSTLLAIIENLDQLDKVMVDIEDLAKRHVEYGTKTHHYRVVGEALLAAIEEHLGDACTPDVREAWQKTYFLLAGVMITAADSAR